MVSFWCGNALLKGDVKNTETYENIRRQQAGRLFLFYLEKLNEIDN